jgi:hypothetical protein
VGIQISALMMVGKLSCQEHVRFSMQPPALVTGRHRLGLRLLDWLASRDARGTIAGWPAAPILSSARGLRLITEWLRGRSPGCCRPPARPACRPPRPSGACDGSMDGCSVPWVAPLRGTVPERSAVRYGLGRWRRPSGWLCEGWSAGFAEHCDVVVAVSPRRGRCARRAGRSTGRCRGRRPIADRSHSCRPRPVPALAAGVSSVAAGGWPACRAGGGGVGACRDDAAGAAAAHRGWPPVPSSQQGHGGGDQ